ncbi:MAG: hypothetical protein MdMp014T_2691 [Treponematales bacterium]
MAKKRFLVLVVAIAAIGLSGCATTSQLGAGTIELKNGKTAPSWRAATNVLYYKTDAGLRFQFNTLSEGTGAPEIYYRVGDAEGAVLVSNSVSNWSFDGVEVIGGVAFSKWSCDVLLDPVVVEGIRAAPSDSVSFRVYNVGATKWTALKMPPADWEGWK